MGILSTAKKLAQSNAGNGGNYFRDGHGRVIVKSMSQEKLYKGETFIAEFLVESSHDDPSAVDDRGNPVRANAPGTSVSFVQQFDEYPDTAYGNVKAFIFTLLDEDENSLAASAVETKKRLETDPGFKAEVERLVGEAVDPSKWDGDLEFALTYSRLVSSANPTRGMHLDYDTYRKTSKKTKIVLTLPRWTHVPQDAEGIKARRAKLDGTPA